MAKPEDPKKPEFSKFFLLFGKKNIILLFTLGFFGGFRSVLQAEISGSYPEKLGRAESPINRCERW